MIKVGVVGCGQWGKNLVRNFHELGALRHICDGDENKLIQLSQSYPDVKQSSRFEDLLSSEVDAIVIAANAEHHAWMAEGALLAGKDVFVEKPLALRYRDGEN